MSWVRRLSPPGNERWEITIEPSGEGEVTVVLPLTMDCTAAGAISTGASECRPINGTESAKPLTYHVSFSSSGVLP